MASEKADTIVLLHGLWVPGAELFVLAARLRRRGFNTHIFNYRSIRHTPQENARRLHAYLAALDIGAGALHLVAHSLGGIVLCHLFDQHPDEKVKRVMMLGTPLNGSHIAHAYNKTEISRKMLGKAIHEGLLGDRPKWKGPDLGMIAGSRGVGLSMITLGGLEKPNDGTVSLKETQSDEVDQHMTMEVSHFGMLFSKKVTDSIASYLHTGVFS